MSKEARKRAMYLLQRQDRTESQLREKLTQGDFSEEEIQDAITYVKDFHYLDDERFARNYVHYSGVHKSKQKLKIALMQKGVSQELIQIALDEEYEGDECAQIKHILKQKSFSVSAATIQDKQKMMMSLYRKGFRVEDIKMVMGDFAENHIED